MAWAGELLSIWGSARQTNKQTNKQNTETNKKNNLLMTWAVELVSIWGRSERFPDLEATRPQGCLALSRTTPCIGTCVQHTKSKKSHNKKYEKQTNIKVTRLPGCLELSRITPCVQAHVGIRMRGLIADICHFIFTLKKFGARKLYTPKCVNLQNNIAL